MRRQNLTRLLVPAIAIAVVLIAAHSAVWFWATGRVADELQAWSTARRAQGWTVAYTLPEREGWPLHAQIRVADLAVAANDVAYRARAAVIGVALLQPMRLVVSPQGDQSIAAARGARIAFTARRTELSTPVDPMPSSADVAIDDLQIAADLATGLGPIAAAQITLHLEGLDAATQRLSLQASGIDVPPASPLAAVGPQIARAKLAATLSRPQPAPAAWRDAGGTLVIQALHLDWGRLSLDAEASLHLDQALQPEGQGRARLMGIDDTLDRLVAAHLVQPRGAMAAKAVLALLARPSEDPGALPMIDVPVALADRTLRLGSFPLARLPVIGW